MYLLLIMMAAASATSESASDDLSRLISSTKTELAQKLIKQRIVKRDENKVSVTYGKWTQMNLNHSGGLGGLFQVNNQNFIFNDFRLLHLQRREFEDTSDEFSLETVTELGVEEGAIFFKHMDWKNIFFLILCYSKGYCQIRMSYSTSDTTFHQRITTHSIPSDVNFFVDNEQLFLIIVRDPCRIFRWTGAYFDEQDELPTTGARTAAIFPEKDRVIIVIIQHLRMEKVYSKVFVKKGKKFELIQLLETQEPVDAVPYTITVEKDVLKFLFVLNGKEASSVFWWNGREFSLWKSLPGVLGPGRIYPGTVMSDLLFFVIHQNELKIYQPAAMTFDLIEILVLEEDIVSMDLRKESDHPPMLIILTRSNMGPYLTIHFISLIVKYVPKSDNQVAVTDPLLQCLFDLDKLLDDRGKRLNNILNALEEVEKGNWTIRLDNLTGRELHLEDYEINTLKVAPPGKTLVATPTEIKEKLDELVEEVEVLRDEMESTSRNKRYRIHGDVTIRKMNATGIQVKKFGNRAFELGNILSLTKNQTLTGHIQVKTLSTDQLTVPTVKGIRVKDFLLREKPLQEIMGEYTISCLKADNIVFGELGKLNGKPFPGAKHHRNDSVVVKGKKSFPTMTTKRLIAKTINNVTAEEWLSKILPSFSTSDKENVLEVDDLTVRNLTVSNINGKPWDEYMKEWAIDQANFTGVNITTVRHLKAKKINGIPTDSFLTATTNQNVSSTIEVDYIAANSVNITNTRNCSNVSGIQDSKVVHGNMTVNEIIFEKPVNVSGTMVDLNRLHEVYWMKSRPQTIETHITFTNGITIRKGLTVGTINGHSMDDFVMTDRSNNVTGCVAFETAEVDGRLTISPDAHQNVNLRQLHDRAVKTTGENLVTGKKIFSGTVEAKRLLVDIINGVNVSGNATLEEVQVVGNVTVKHGVNLTNLNGENFDKIASTALKIDDPDLPELTNLSNLTVSELNLDKIEDLKSRKSFQRNRKRKRVNVIIYGNLDVPEIRTETVNGIPFSDYMSKVVYKNDTSKTIKGRKVFEGEVTITGNLEGVLNDFNLTQLYDTALSKTRPQNITGNYTVDELIGNNLNAKAIGGVPVDKLLFQDRNYTQTINSDLIFNSISVMGHVNSSDFMNGCNFLKATTLDLQNVKNIRNLELKGNVAWKKNRPEIKGLSYLFENVVTTDEEQIITGSVTFLGNVSFQKLNTKSHINDVDLEFIVNDALFRSSPLQEISQNVTFKGTFKADNILVMNNVIVDNINGLDVLDFDQRLIRNNADTVVRGKKVFLNGFEAFNLNAEFVNGARTDQIIFYGEEDMVRFPPTTFHSVNIAQDLKVKRVNNVDLEQLMLQRVSKTKAQTILGHITVDGNLTMKGNTDLSRINDVNINETIMVDGEASPRVITGNITFNNSLDINGQLELKSFHGLNLTNIYERALLNGQDAVIHGNVVFNDGIESHGNIDVLQDTNGCKVGDIQIPEIPQDIGRSEFIYERLLRSEIEKMTNATSILVKPLLFRDLEEKAVVDLEMAMPVRTQVSTKNDSVTLNVYGMDHKILCGLPSDCLCPEQTTLSIPIAVASGSISVVKSSPRYYIYEDVELGVEVTVTSTTVSYNSRCQNVDSVEAKESTAITWRRIGTSEDSQNPFTGPTYSMGFLSDARFFKIGESIYTVLALYYHPSTEHSSQLNVSVIELDTTVQIMKMIQEIPNTGSEALEVFWTTKGVMMVIGNGFDSELFTDSVDTAVYRFNGYENKFELLRQMKTHGVQSISSARHNRDSFIFLVQKQTWPLLIFKYNHEYDNYYLIQKVDVSRSRVKSNFLSATAFATERAGYDGDIFLGVVFTDESFRLYKYKYIQGFVEEIRVEQKNVRLLQSFWAGSRQYLFAGSSGYGSTVYEIVQEGFIDEI